MNKLLSRILALLLVLVLIVNISPIRVQASALPEVAGVVTKVIPFNPAAGAAAGGTALAGQVFGWVLTGIGIVATTAAIVDLMHRYSEFSGELEMSIYYYPDGSWSYGVDMGFVERVRAFLWGEGILQSVNFVDCIPDNFAYQNNFSIAYRTACESPFACLFTWPEGSGIAWALYISDSGFNLTTIDGYSAITSGSTISRCFYSSTTFSPLSVNYVKYGSDVSVQMFIGALTTISSSYGSIGIVAPPEVDVPLGYPEWHTNARPATDPDTEEEITILPIPLDPNNDTEALPDGVTQPDAWQGTVADPLPDTGTDTDPDTGTDTDGSLANTPWDAVKKWVSDFFIPSGDITMYSLDLTELFPFCIPFDIFDLLSALRADPVAPVFELELDFGVTKAPITVDLSGWSDLASIIRILEVGLFCLGLALGTKELIGS